MESSGGSEQVISQVGSGRATRATVSRRGRGRDYSAGSGRGVRQSFGPPRGQERQLHAEFLVGEPERQGSFPPGLQQTKQRLSQGFVITLLDSYGFIRVPGEPEQIFFHGSEVKRSSSSDTANEQFNLLKLLQVGDEVSFELRQNTQKENRINAVNIHKLQPGTITALQSAGKGRYRGTIKSTPEASSWRSQDITPGKILFTKPSITGEDAPQQQAEYRPADLREANLKLRSGDKVEFRFAAGDDSADDSQAKDITLVARAASAAASGGRQLGCIVAAKEGFGFIRPASKATERIYFKAGDVVGTPAHAIPLNGEVSFVMVPDPRGREDVATNVQILPSTFLADQLAPETGTRQGKVAKLAKASSANTVLDGLLTFTEGQATLYASYGQFQVQEGTELKLEDEVSFRAGLNASTGAYKALSVSLEISANERENKRELGQIKSMKKEFGFIKCCERVADMFFHHSALDGGPEAFAVGDDVSFKVVKESKGDRPNAIEIQQTPQGSAVFEEVTEQQHTGKVAARLVPPRGYNAAGESGLVVFDGPDGKQQLPFGLQDLQEPDVNPASGDTVTFKVATNIAAAKVAARAGAPNWQYAGKRAVTVALVQQQGLVVSCAGSSGVVEFSPDLAYDMKDRSNKQRIPFQSLEESSQATLKPSDVVQFLVLTDARGKEKRATRLILVKEGDGVVPNDLPAKNPNAMKFTGGTPEVAGKARPNQAARIARGPDGTRGFTAALQPGNRARLLPPPAPVDPTPVQTSSQLQEAAHQSKLKADERRLLGQSQRQPGAQPGAPRAQAAPSNQTPVRNPNSSSSSSSKRPTAILQPPGRQQLASPVPRQQAPSPPPPSQAGASAPPPQLMSAQLSTSSAQINDIQPVYSQNGSGSQSRRQRQRQQKPSVKPGHALHRQAVQASAEQAAQQAPASDVDPQAQPVTTSVLRAQQGNAMPIGAISGVAMSGVNGVLGGSKTMSGSPGADSPLQRTASGKLRATAAPFVPCASSLKP